MVPLLLLALNLLGGNLGPLSPATCRSAALGSLAAAWFAGAAVCARQGLRALGDRAAILSLAISLVMLLASDDRTLWIAGLALAALGLSRLLDECEAQAAHGARAAGHAAVFYLVMMLVLRHVPLAWNGVQALSEAASAGLGQLFRTGVVQGPSTGGLFIYVSFLAYWVARAAFNTERQWLMFDLGAVLLTGLFVAQLGAGPWLALELARAALPSLSAHPHLGAGSAVEDSLIAMYSPVLLIVAGLVVVALLEPLWSSRERMPLQSGTAATPPASRQGRFTLAAGVAACLAMVAVLWGQFPGQRSVDTGGRVLFYRDAKDTLRKFDVPDFEHLGTANAGMFGLLPKYLSAWGYEPAHLDPAGDGLDEQALRGCAAVVIINPDRPFLRPELQAIWSYVEKGGALLVLGDHTDIGGTMQPLNTLLEPVDIRFNFDSAFTATHWRNVVEPLPHPITVGLDAANERLQHSTGASLSVGCRARPVVSARWAFSDAGDRGSPENAFLGDYAYQLSEPLSDRIIIAEGRYGSGKVLVFGDTSAFQNLGLAHSFAFVERVFRHLTRGRAPHAWPGWAGAGVLVGLWVLSTRAGARLLGRPIPTLTLFPGLGLLWIWPVVGPARAESAPRGDLACIDAAHVNRFALGYWKDDSISGWVLNLERNGYLPLVKTRPGPWNELAGAKLLTVIAPARAYSDAELRAVRTFVESGGLLVLSVGYEEKAGSEGLLRLAGFDIREVALGPVPIEPPQRTSEALAETMRAPHFRKAWPLVSTGSGAAEVFYRQGLYDIIAFRRIGKGGALVIADPCFLYDKTLEAEKAWWPGNIHLIRSILTTLRSRGVGL